LKIAKIFVYTQTEPKKKIFAYRPN